MPSLKFFGNETRKEEKKFNIRKLTPQEQFSFHPDRGTGQMFELRILERMRQIFELN